MNKYNDLLEHYEKNKQKKWSDWLIFDGCLKSQGKQGIIGFFKIKNTYQKGDKIIYKKLE